ncbi:MAG: hypothetical protein ABEJ27_07045 [Halodesulfurarchaeum sp.]
MLACTECGYEAPFASRDWTYTEQDRTLDPAILVVECPECRGIVDTRVEL